ncbi:hypothetical protein [Flavobacterium sp. TSSA_36]|uniref:hypothetical protein n=1 Tax=Flavobacterium sp. TSSA_36 TaxID=3447669 RepID=UPI003F2DBAFA
MSKTTTDDEALFYASKTVELAWTRDILQNVSNCVRSAEAIQYIINRMELKKEIEKLSKGE